MKVFISWSGDYSKALAEILRQWIPAVIQAVKPYYTPDDITKGTRWSSDISRELDQSKIGIICLTKDNLKSPWIMFEAGALSKKMEESKVVPMLFGVEPTDIEGPLIQFQAAKFSKAEMKKTVVMINKELGDGRLTDEVLENVFEMWWPKLELDINSVKQETTLPDNKDSRSEKALLEEILSLTRGLVINQSSFERKHLKGTGLRLELLPKAFFHDLIVGIENLLVLGIEDSLESAKDARPTKALRKLQHSLTYMQDKEMYIYKDDFLRDKFTKVDLLIDLLLSKFEREDGFLLDPEKSE